MIFNKTEEQEKEYLRQIIGIINDTINNTDKSVKEHVDTLKEYKDYLWSNKDIDPHEIRSMRESILRHFASGEGVIHKRERLGKILDIPYFGRIDFRERKEGSATMPLYIGIHTFYDADQKMNLIYDWRAPISSIYYNGGLLFRVCFTITNWEKQLIFPRRERSAGRFRSNGNTAFATGKWNT